MKPLKPVFLNGRSALLYSFFGVAVCQGAILEFDVTVNTTPLVGHASAPFSLEFQLIDGSGAGDGNNSVTLSLFDFHGGSWAGPSSTTLTDSSFFSDFVGEFVPGSLLSFRVSLTTSVDAGGVPDQFSFAILDTSGWEIPAFGLGDALLSVDIDSAAPAVLTFGSDLSRTTINIDAPSVTIVPEPGAMAACFGILCGIVAVGKRGCRARLRRASP